MKDILKTKKELITELEMLRRHVVGLEQLVYESRGEEVALRESERLYRLLAENAEDVIWTVDMNMQPTYMSPSVTRLLGYSVEEAMAKPMEAGLYPCLVCDCHEGFSRRASHRKHGTEVTVQVTDAGA